MNALKTQSLFFFLLFFFFSDRVLGNDIVATCGEDRCEPAGPAVRFPFWLRNRQARRCGQGPAFELSCNNRSQTVIDLRRPGSAKTLVFSVETIDYEAQSLSINDPDHCLPRRLVAGDLAAAAAAGGGGQLRFGDRFESYTFLRCSPEAGPFRRPVPCLGLGVAAVPAVIYEGYVAGISPDLESPAPAPAPAREARRCETIGAAEVPDGDAGGSVSGPARPFLLGLDGPVRLTWRMPECRECERRGGVCRPRGTRSEVGCSVSLQGRTSGLPRSAKYGIIIGAGIPGLLCIIGLASYIFGRVRAIGQTQQTYPSLAGLEAPRPSTGVVMGLDGPTIESFPKIELGESKRLPKPNDNTCPICLSEYQPKETLRTIPECNHYFHANCVDEWLKMNATCPLCRNSPDGSSHASLSTSVSSSPSSSSLSSA